MKVYTFISDSWKNWRKLQANMYQIHHPLGQIMEPTRQGIPPQIAGF